MRASEKRKPLNAPFGFEREVPGRTVQWREDKSIILAKRKRNDTVRLSTESIVYLKYYVQTDKIIRQAAPDYTLQWTRQRTVNGQMGECIQIPGFRELHYSQICCTNSRISRSSLMTCWWEEKVKDGGTWERATMEKRGNLVCKRDQMPQTRIPRVDKTANGRRQLRGSDHQNSSGHGTFIRDGRSKRPTLRDYRFRRR